MIYSFDKRFNKYYNTAHRPSNCKPLHKFNCVVFFQVHSCVFAPPNEADVSNLLEKL